MEPGINILKLITGETVIADVEYDKLKKHATLNHPLIFNIQYKQTGGASMVATKWIESKKTSHKIKTYHIIAADKPTQMMEDLYVESVQDMIEYDASPSTSNAETDEQIIDYLESLEDVEEEIITVH